MKTVKQRKFFEKLENHKKGRVHHLKGIGEITIPRIYSFKQKGSTICLLCKGDKIHSFPKDVTIQDIRDFIENYKPLKDYCKAPTSQCQQVKNCNICHTLHKKYAEERRERGEINKTKTKRYFGNRYNNSPH
jgi:hypothetical protein